MKWVNFLLFLHVVGAHFLQETESDVDEASFAEEIPVMGTERRAEQSIISTAFPIIYPPPFL